MIHPMFYFRSPPPPSPCSSPVDMQSYELCSDIIDVVIDVSCIYGTGDDGAASAYDEKSGSIIKLSNNTVLYLREVNKYVWAFVLPHTHLTFFVHHSRQPWTAAIPPPLSHPPCLPLCTQVPCVGVLVTEGEL